ncbi:hypothetical protein RB595_008318 [Gaeumannomyces hyphopodioides]
MRPQRSLARTPEADIETQPLLRTPQSYDPGDASPEQQSARPTRTRPVSVAHRFLLQALWPVSLLSVIVIAVVWAVYLITWVAPRALNPTPPSAEQRARDAEWVSGSPYWADRQACRWLSLCGVHHLRWDPPAIEGGGAGERSRGAEASVRTRVGAGLRRPRAKVVSSKGARQVPEYVLRHAPLVHLHSGESFWPASVEEHAKHMRPVNHTAPGGNDGDSGGSRVLLNLTSLDSLDAIHSGAVYLTSTEDVETRPSWLSSRDGLPSSADDESAGRSTAPAVLVLVEKETDGGPVLDAFWFFFYSYNLGQTVLGVRFGNHVGDWEHCMVRFARGEPTAVFLSEHEGGQAYAWRALEKAAAASNDHHHPRPSGDGDRPVIYSAVGSHAMYATPGSHPYVLPFGMLKDVTDKGPLWDPAKNAWAYWHEPPERSGEDEGGQKGEGVFEPAAPISSGGGKAAPAPAGWLGFSGRWGDELYGLDNRRQWRLFNQYHYVNGPAGPADKHLWRDTMCPQSRCRILDSLEAGRKRTWYA